MTTPDVQAVLERALLEGEGPTQRLTWWCAGCAMPHAVSVAPGGWHWDGSLVTPTLSPSVSVRMTFTDSKRPDRICHSFVREGRMQYLSDCTHRLAGQTVEIEPWAKEHA